MILLLVEQLSDDRTLVLMLMKARSSFGESLAPLNVRLVPLLDSLAGIRALQFLFNLTLPFPSYLLVNA